jgi:hypothetical protein
VSHLLPSSEVRTFPFIFFRYFHRPLIMKNEKTRLTDMTPTTSTKFEQIRFGFDFRLMHVSGRSLVIDIKYVHIPKYCNENAFRQDIMNQLHNMFANC